MRTWVRHTLLTHALLYFAGLAVWSVEHEFAYGILVVWVVALASSFAIGLVTLGSRPYRNAGLGIVLGTLIAFAVELLVTLGLAAAWLASHPGWELS
jgi:hypothetical protein